MDDSAELKAALERAEKAETELAAARRTLEVFIKEREDQQQIAAVMMTFVPDIDEKMKALSPEEAKERVKIMSERLIEKARLKEMGRLGLV